VHACIHRGECMRVNVCVSVYVCTVFQNKMFRLFLTLQDLVLLLILNDVISWLLVSNVYAILTVYGLLLI
jgi:hypothetical protein